MNEPYMLEGLKAWKEYMTEKDDQLKTSILKNKDFRKRVKEEIYDTSKNKLFVGNWEKIKLIESC